MGVHHLGLALALAASTNMLVRVSGILLLLVKVSSSHTWLYPEKSKNCVFLAWSHAWPYSWYSLLYFSTMGFALACQG